MDVAMAHHDQIGRIRPGLFAPHRWSRTFSVRIARSESAFRAMRLHP
jgi:hypothetical protein